MVSYYTNNRLHAYRIDNESTPTSLCAYRYTLTKANRFFVRTQFATEIYAANISPRTSQCLPSELRFEPPHPHTNWVQLSGREGHTANDIFTQFKNCRKFAATTGIVCLLPLCFGCPVMSKDCYI